MKVEVLSEIITELADKLGIYESQYGSYEQLDRQGGHPEDCKCRICFEIEYDSRIRSAIENEQTLRDLNIKIQ